MPKYEYEAVDPARKTRHKGVIEAPSLEEGLRLLMQRKIFPSYFSEMTDSQVNVAKRIAKFKKLTQKPQQLPPPPAPEDVVIPQTPKSKFTLDWTYVVLAGIVLVLVFWAITAH